MTTIEITLPAFCAPYLINNDDSDGRAVYEADRRCADFNLDPQTCLDMKDERIERFLGRLTDVATFTFPR